MLVVKVEVWPGGMGAEAKEIARIGLTNRSHVSRTTADYDVTAIMGRDTVEQLLTTEVIAHRRDKGWPALLLRALLDIAYGEPTASYAREAVEHLRRDGR